jgi:hypothetical protein
VGFFFFNIFIIMRGDVDYIISLMKEFTYTDKEGELDEQDDAGASSAGGSTGGGGGGTYPTVTKWSSGRKFGPTYNPEQPIWNGNGISRSKGNTLL